MSIAFRKFSYRGADCILSSKKDMMSELETVLRDLGPLSDLSRPVFNKTISDNFEKQAWKKNVRLLDPPNDGIMKIDYLKNRVQVEIESGHPSFIGTDLVKFQLASYSGNNLADVGVYVVPTENFMNIIISQHNKKWIGSITYEKATRCIEAFRTVIQCPILILGLDYGLI